MTSKFLILISALLLILNLSCSTTVGLSGKSRPTIKLVAFNHSDYTKLDSIGNKLPGSAESWSCVLDNHTGLIWEVKTDDGGARDKDNKYRWGGKGVSIVALEVILSSLGPINKYYAYFWDGNGERYNDWNKLIDAANYYEKLCGFSDWRVPELYELSSLVRCRGSYHQSLDDGCSGGTGDYRLPTIDTDYFPNSQFRYWSASPHYSKSSHARLLYLHKGIDGSMDRSHYDYVRLVRSSQ